MSNSIWLLVENVENKGEDYDIVKIDPVKCQGQDIRTGKMIYIRTQEETHPRKVLVRRISVSKKALKNYKKFLQRQEAKYNNIVTECIQTARKIKNEKLRFITPTKSRSSSSPSRGNDDSDDSINSTEENQRKFNQIVESLARFSTHFKRNDKPKEKKSYRRSYPSGKERRRSMVSSTPKPGNREQIKLTFDQATQTDPTGPDAAEQSDDEEEVPLEYTLMEELVKQLYRQFTQLISSYERDTSVDSVYNSLLENNRAAAARRALPAIEEGTDSGQQSSTDSGPEQVISSSNKKGEAGPSKPKMLKVRRVSAQTTNTLDLSRSNDMVPIGNGHAQVPARLMDEINWGSYTSATRQLLQAVFPRKVLATHSLTGKQSPAFLDKPAKKCLDPKLVDDIVLTVTQRCGPGVTDRLVRNCITIKCTDEAKLYRNRLQCRYGRLPGPDQENVPPGSSTSDTSESN